MKKQTFPINGFKLLKCLFPVWSSDRSKICCAETNFRNLPGSLTFSLTSLHSSSWFVACWYERVCYCTALAVRKRLRCVIIIHCCSCSVPEHQRPEHHGVNGNVNANWLSRHSVTLQFCSLHTQMLTKQSFWTRKSVNQYFYSKPFHKLCICTIFSNWFVYIKMLSIWP